MAPNTAEVTLPTTLAQQNALRRSLWASGLKLFPRGQAMLTPGLPTAPVMVTATMRPAMDLVWGQVRQSPAAPALGLDTGRLLQPSTLLLAVEKRPKEQESAPPFHQAGQESTWWNLTPVQWNTRMSLLPRPQCSKILRTGESTAIPGNLEEMHIFGYPTSTVPDTRMWSSSLCLNESSRPFPGTLKFKIYVTMQTRSRWKQIAFSPLYDCYSTKQEIHQEIQTIP
jgi:hypothetical protein